MSDCNSTAKPYAVLLIDVQQWFSDGVKEAFPRFERNINELISLVYKNKITIIHIYGNEDPKQRDLKWTNMQEHKQGMFLLKNNQPSLFLKKHPNYEQFNIKKNNNNSTIVIKSLFNAFDQTNLHKILQSKGIEHIFLAGLLTSVCILNTGMGAFSRGYNVNIIKDCCADFSRTAHQNVIHTYSHMMWKTLLLKDLINACKDIEVNNTTKMRHISSKL